VACDGHGLLELGGGLDYVSRRMCVSHSLMFHVCSTKKILIRGLVSPRDHTSSHSKKGERCASVKKTK
jgi:hypothetical protein